MSVDHYENFPVASILCPPALRPAVTAIYWYARTADDLADEGDVTTAQRLADLAQYRSDLHAAASARPGSGRWVGVFEPLSATLARHALPLQLLEDLLDAFELDLHQPRHADRDSLLAYCRCSANPIGRLLLHLYGVHEAGALRQSDAICTALQLINFWQDLSVDLPRGRLYLPLADCERHGLDASALLASASARTDARRCAPLVAELAAWTRAMMNDGADLVHHLPGRLGWELRLVVQGGLRILDKVEALQGGVFTQRPKLHAWNGPRLLLRALRM
jgi:hydroxysqualene synthase